MNYEEKLKEAKRLYQTANFDQRYVLESLFPELKESEDGKIRKVLIDYFNRYKEQEECGIDTFYGIPTDSIIAWLEKPDNPNPYSGTSFKHNGHTWGMCARDCGVDLMLDGKLRASFNADGDVF